MATLNLAFSDGTYPLDGGAFFGVIPKVMWSRKMTADNSNRITSGLNSLLVRTGKETVLIETGIGSKLPDRMVKFYGQPAKLLDNLASAGVGPEDIDIVINSHTAFRSLRMEHDSRQKRRDRADISPRAIFRSRGRVEVCAASERARRDQLHLG